MITIEKLCEFGADVDDGLSRCLNKADLYIYLVCKLTEDKTLYLLEQQLIRKDLDGAFETAHSLKGVYANLSLTPLTGPVTDMTELLRNRTDTEYTGLIDKLKTGFEKLCEL